MELDSESATKAVNFISEFPAAILERFPTAAIFKISTLPTELPEIANRLSSLELPWLVMMRGLGVVYLAIFPAPNSNDSSRKYSTSRAIV